MLTPSYGGSFSFEMKSEPELSRLIKRAFPGYKKRSAYLSTFTSCNVNSYWDGGSRNEYVLLNVESGERLALPTASHPYFDVARHGIANVESAAVSVDRVGGVTLKQLPPNCVLIQAGTACGKPATAQIMAPAEMMPKYLNPVIYPRHTCHMPSPEPRDCPACKA